jgi:deoxyribodipyrimidine photo-lyase
MNRSNYPVSLFIFHRDLRIHDNTALIAACKQSDKVIAAFIFTPEQVGDSNTYKGDHCLEFMLTTLHELAQDIAAHGGRLYFFKGHMEEVIKQLIKEADVRALFFNYDYTPYARARDKDIERLCKAHDVAVHGYHDALLNAPGIVMRADGKPYQVFTPFWKAARVIPVAKDSTYRSENLFHGHLKHALSAAAVQALAPVKSPELAVHGGRKEGLKLMRRLAHFSTYEATRDTPSLDTTMLSAHNKFGTISIRELYWHMQNALGARAGTGLLRQLYWRDFYYHVAYFWPHVFGHAFHRKYDALAWNKSKKDFALWCTGMTGFPIVDAGMRQLNATGFMHNRVRMIVASFLTKDLLIDWRWGERYFAQQLVDYDPCVNNGNWQWSASTGCDPQPYFRIFNPWLQQKKFDADCTYIKQWVPEVRHVAPKVLHSWYADRHEPIEGYPRPMVDHEEARAVALAAYKKVAKE